MRISTPNKPRRRRNGFTLVELMVVLFIIGLAGAAIVLTVRSASVSVGSQAEVFAARVAALRDRAIVESRPFAIWVRASGYGFEERAGGAWRPLDRKPFETTDWQQPTVARIKGGQVLRIAFDGNGLPSAPMEISVAGGNRDLRVSINGAGDVDVAP
ncbi:MAG: GspH/FimT family pseudopilin [Sphingorhabdus sp.]